MTVAQAKARLLELGLEAEAARGEQGGLVANLRKVSAFAPLLATVAPLVATVLGIVVARAGSRGKAAARYERHERSIPPRAFLGLSLGTLIKLARPLIPVVMQYVAKRRATSGYRHALREQKRVLRAEAARLRKVERARVRSDRMQRRGR